MKDKTKDKENNLTTLEEQEVEIPEISIEEFIMFILGLVNRPIIGRIVLFKEVFLFYDKLKKRLKIQDPIFFSYRYGPYSVLLAQVIDMMEFAGLIIRHGRRGSKKERFELTDKGKRIAKKLIEKLKEKLGEDEITNLIKMRKGLDQLGTEGILRYVYQNYPDFGKRSEIADRYKTIKWGVGIG